MSRDQGDTSGSSDISVAHLPRQNSAFRRSFSRSIDRGIFTRSLCRSIGAISMSSRYENSFDSLAKRLRAWRIGLRTVGVFTRQLNVSTVDCMIRERTAGFAGGLCSAARLEL